MPAELTASMYQAKSGNQRGKDYQMFPKTPDLSVTYNEVTTPAPTTVVERPTYVILNKADTYNFLYHTTCSLGSTVPTANAEKYTQGAVVPSNGTPVELPVNPVAWEGGSTGDVTFVYKGVK